MTVEPTSSDIDRLVFEGRITQLLPGGRGGFVTFDAPLKSAQRGFFHASLLDKTFLSPASAAARVKGVALANGAIVAEIVELTVDDDA